MLSGVLFQAYLQIALAIAFGMTGNPTLAWLMQVNLLIASVNLLPFIRLDGHHVAGELVGMLEDKGRVPWVRRVFNLTNLAATVIYAAYIAYVWQRSLLEVERAPTVQSALYFAFVTAICAGLCLVMIRILVRRLRPARSVQAEAGPSADLPKS